MYDDKFFSAKKSKKNNNIKKEHDSIYDNSNKAKSEKKINKNSIFGRCSVLSKKTRDYYNSEIKTKPRSNLVTSQVSLTQTNPAKYNLDLEDLLHRDGKPKISNSLSSSEAKYSQQNLSSLMNLSECCFPVPNLDDFETKVKFFILEKLPNLLKNIQPIEVSKMVLVLSTILISNRIPKRKIKFNKIEKTVLKIMILKGLKKEISSK